jgi:transcriptional regulator with XRE-family HTH domain
VAIQLLERFGAGLQKARKSLGLTQEDFSVVLSRIYLSTLERGMKSSTLSKIEDLASVIGVHPLSLLALAYLPEKQQERDEMCARIRADIDSLERTSAMPGKFD